MDEADWGESAIANITAGHYTLLGVQAHNIISLVLADDVPDARLRRQHRMLAESSVVTAKLFVPTADLSAMCAAFESLTTEQASAALRLPVNGWSIIGGKCADDQPVAASGGGSGSDDGTVATLGAGDTAPGDLAANALAAGAGVDPAYLGLLAIPGLLAAAAATRLYRKNYKMKMASVASKRGTDGDADADDDDDEESDAGSFHARNSRADRARTLPSAPGTTLATEFVKRYGLTSQTDSCLLYTSPSPRD